MKRHRSLLDTTITRPPGAACQQRKVPDPRSTAVMHNRGYPASWPCRRPAQPVQSVIAAPAVWARAVRPRAVLTLRAYANDGIRVVKIATIGRGAA